MASSDFKKELQNMLTHYLAQLTLHEKKGHRIFMNEELEVRFKPHNKKNFSKNDYDNVISRLMACNYSCKNSSGINMLRIQTQYKAESGQMLMSNIRTEICGSDVIQDYCKNDDNLKKILDMKEHAKKIKFTQKSPAKYNDAPIKKIENTDFNFNVSFNLETDYFANQNNGKETRVKEIIENWTNSKKTFRLINRIRFEHDILPIAIDLSIIRTSKTSNGIMIPEYNLQDSDLFNNQEVCEIELEVINNRVGIATPYNDVEKIINEMQLVIKIVLGGIQSTKYPIPYSEQEQVLNSYMQLIHGNVYQSRRILTRDFIGPNSCTLQLKNIIENENSIEPNIVSDHYCVTDKADGDRKLLFINKEGRIYLIDTNMRVQFTGSKVDRNEFGNTLIDGEHIQYDKDRAYKNTYAAFDIYFEKGESKRNLNFYVNNETKITKEDLEKYRYLILSRIVYNMNNTNTIQSVTKNKRNDIEVNVKMFYFPDKGKNIFKMCSELLSKLDSNTYQYETDGLIFTPIYTGVGGMGPGQASKMEKVTWPLSFKWKPPQFNTIDFLVAYKYDKTGKEIIHNRFVDGINTDGTSVQQYRTIVLMCGFNRKSHIIINPFQDVLDDNIPKNMYSDNDNEETYIPVPFEPSSPYDPTTCFANIDIVNGTGKMVTEMGEFFEKDMIVEFSYNLENKKWIPLRVRHDKTYDFKMGNKNYGNAYHVANDNWKSIHYPITQEMLSGQGIPNKETGDDVYYNKTQKNNYTIGLRNFHNLYVKKRLIRGVAKQDDILIDYAVGKGGDIPKWKLARLKFVLGIDISPDNIYNQNDGVCTRYLNERKQTRQMFNALFLPGDSRLNIKNGSAFFKDKEKEVAKSVFGSNKLNSQLGKAVTQNYGIGNKGFNVSSCQFAIHYMFENNTILHNFLRNVSECTAVNGYFIGTCYDGQTVFNKLKKSENYSIYVDGNLIFDIQKKYNQTGFPEDENSVGYPINVYQESINKYATEYLVNFKYLVHLMEDYGFKLIDEEAKAMGFPSGSGLFEDLFRQMNRESNSNSLYGEATNMSREEKEISFLNRYFIFRKTHDVKADKVFETIKNSVAIEDKKSFEEAVKETLKKPVMFVKKLKRKVILHAYDPVQELVRQEESLRPEQELVRQEEEDSVQEVVRQESIVQQEAVQQEAVQQEKKARCADGTRRFAAMGPDCYTPEQIEEHKKNKTQKLKKK